MRIPTHSAGQLGRDRDWSRELHRARIPYRRGASRAPSIRYSECHAPSCRSRTVRRGCTDSRRRRASRYASMPSRRAAGKTRRNGIERAGTSERGITVVGTTRRLAHVTRCGRHPFPCCGKGPVKNQDGIATIFPMKRIVPESRSRIAKRNGRSTRIVGTTGSETTPISTDVTAAASVPSS